MYDIKKTALRSFSLLLAALLIFLLAKHCMNELFRGEKETESTVSWEYINPTEEELIIIAPESLEVALDTLESITEITELEAWTAAEDTVKVSVYVNTETEEVIVSGTVNGNPIIGADIEVINPSIDLPADEENGDVALLIDRTFREEDQYSAGFSYEPVHFYDGRLRFGAAATVDIHDFDEATLAIRGAWRESNVSVGVNYGARFNGEEVKKQVSVNLGLYL